MRIDYPDRLDQNIELDMPLISTVGFDHILNPIGLKPHIHEGYELVYLVEGETCWQIEADQEIYLKGGQTSIIQPNTNHSGKWDIIPPATFFWIIIDTNTKQPAKNTTFDTPTIKKIFDIYTKASNIAINTGKPFEVLYHQLRYCMTSVYLGSTNSLMIPKIRNLLCQIILDTALALENNQTRQSSNTITAAIAYINSNLDKDLSVSDIAQTVALSTTKFSEYFKAETGQSPADYFRRQKCAKAREMLTTSRKSITDIAFSLGFSSSQYFAKVFKKYTSMTPQEFRSKNK